MRHSKGYITSEKTTGARNLQETTQGALDKRILWSVNTVKQNLALISKKRVNSELRVDVITRS
jgi:hypothetical protein